MISGLIALRAKWQCLHGNWRACRSYKLSTRQLIALQVFGESDASAPPALNPICIWIGCLWGWRWIDRGAKGKERVVPSHKPCYAFFTLVVVMINTNTSLRDATPTTTLIQRKKILFPSWSGTNSIDSLTEELCFNSYKLN